MSAVTAGSTARPTSHGYGTQLTQAHNQALTAQSQIEEIDAKLRDTRSFAPFDGVITRKMVEEGDTVQPGQPLLEFADLTYLQVEVDVPVRLMPGLKKGMLIPARLDVGNVRVDVRVAQIFPSADPIRHTVTVKFDLPVNVPGGPGMYAEVMVPDIVHGGQFRAGYSGLSGAVARQSAGRVCGKRQRRGRAAADPAGRLRRGSRGGCVVGSADRRTHLCVTTWRSGAGLESSWSKVIARRLDSGRHDG